MNKCIAFVDDDEQICRYFREYATYRGYACHCYHEAESALKAIVRNREGVWAVCVDLTLPGSPLQGPELITELRVRGVSAPIFVVTEDVSPTTQLALTNKNIDGYIRKRDLTRPLLFKIIETAWEKRGYSGSIIEVGALRYDAETHVVSYRGKVAEPPLEPFVDADKSLVVHVSIHNSLSHKEFYPLIQAVSESGAKLILTGQPDD